MTDRVRYRATERPWETIDRRRYAVERHVATLPDGSGHWSIERFFSSPLDAQLYLGRLQRGPRVIAELTTSSAAP